MKIINLIKNSNRLKHFRLSTIEYFHYLEDVLNLLKNKFNKNKIEKIDLVTASDNFFFDSLIQLLDNVAFSNKFENITVYNLGLKKSQINTIYSNFPKVILKNFQFNKFPKHVGERDNFNKMGSYSWKSVIIYDEVIYSKNLVLWMDSANLLDGNIDNLKKIISFKGFYSPYSDGVINNWTHTTTLELMKVNTKTSNKRNLTGGIIGVNPRNRKVVQFIKTWRIKCLDSNLINPVGSSRENHRQDQSLLSILFHKNFSKGYYFKSKKISGIKVNQNPSQKLYILDNIIHERFKKEWIKNYSSITTNTVFDAEIIFLFSVKELNKIPKKVIKNIKLIFIYIDSYESYDTVKELYKNNYILIFSHNLEVKVLNERISFYNLKSQLDLSLNEIRQIVDSYV